MAQDANLTLQASVTKTATFSGAWVELGAQRRTLYAHVFYSAASNASGANTVTFSLDISPDNGVTTYAGEFVAADQIITLSTVAQAGEIVIPLELFTSGVIKAIETGLQAVRLTVTIAGAGTVPTITYSGAIELGAN